MVRSAAAKRERGNKPQMELYVPGSGPLRKSAGYRGDEVESNGKVSVVESAHSGNSSHQATVAKHNENKAPLTFLSENVDGPRSKHLNYNSNDDNVNRIVESVSDISLGGEHGSSSRKYNSNRRGDRNPSNRRQSPKRNDSFGGTSRRKMKKPDIPLYLVRGKHQNTVQRSSSPSLQQSQTNICSSYNVDINSSDKSNIRNHSNNANYHSDKPSIPSLLQTETIISNTGNRSAVNSNRNSNDSNNNLDNKRRDNVKSFNSSNSNTVDHTKDNYKCKDHQSFPSNSADGDHKYQPDEKNDRGNESESSRRSKNDRRKRRGKQGTRSRNGDNPPRTDSVEVDQDPRAVDEKRSSYMSINKTDSSSNDVREGHYSSTCDDRDSFRGVIDDGGKAERQTNKYGGSRRITEDNSARDIRRSSEPRTLPQHHYKNSYVDRRDSNSHSVRDTRSVEPGDVRSSNFNGSNTRNSKLNASNASGSKYSNNSSGNNYRRNNNTKMIHPLFDSLPPRLQKQYMAKNGIPQQRCVPVEDSWDGTSVTFQGRSTGGNYCANNMQAANDATVYSAMNTADGNQWNMNYQRVPVSPYVYARPSGHESDNQQLHVNYYPLPYGMIPPVQHPGQNQPTWSSHTLPVSGLSRGRGRLNHDDLKNFESQSNSYNSRSLTPDIETVNTAGDEQQQDQHCGDQLVTSSSSSVGNDANYSDDCQDVYDDDYYYNKEKTDGQCANAEDNYEEEEEPNWEFTSNVYNNKNNSGNKDIVCHKSSPNNDEGCAKPVSKKNDDDHFIENESQIEVPTADENVFQFQHLTESLDWSEEVERSERLESCSRNHDTVEITNVLNPVNQTKASSDITTAPVAGNKQLNNDSSRNLDSHSLSTTPLPPNNSMPPPQNVDNRRREGRRPKKTSSGSGRSDAHIRSMSRERRSHGSTDRRTNSSGNLTNKERENLSWRADNNDCCNRGSRNNSTERWQSYGRNRGERHRRNSSNERQRQNNVNRSKDKSRKKYQSKKKEKKELLRRGSNSNNLDEITNWRNELRPPCPQESRVSNSASHRSITPISSTTTNVCSTMSVTSDEQHSSPGIIVLPNSAATVTKSASQNKDHPDIPAYPAYSGNIQRHLFNPNNPNEPIVVAANCNRIAPHLQKDSSQAATSGQQNVNFDNSTRTIRNPALLMDIDRCENELMLIISTGYLAQCWQRVSDLRNFLQDAQRALLINELKFCQQTNVEQHIWKLLFYNIIEHLRIRMTETPESADQFRQLILNIIKDGIKYYESLLSQLEAHHNIKFDDYLNPDCTKGLGYIGLALVSAQKLFLYIGDLARYKEQVNDSSNYGIPKQWYTKAQQINPKNSRPYNQLAVLAIYTRRKLDAVYYYMRSLMSSNPLQSAKESLLSMFDENRKKYDLTEKKRKEERDQRQKERMKEKEELVRGRFRREVWIHPGGGKRMLRTTSASSVSYEHDSDEEELHNMDYLALNKRFGVSYLHVHGKLFTKVGMETFQETAIQMLKEFRALLQHTPIPVNLNRFLQLLALNMFAIENTQLKNDDLEPSYRSATQECALIISLQMFSLILERCVQLLKEQINAISSTTGSFDSGNGRNEGGTSAIVTDVRQHEQRHAEIQMLLSAIKVWCDWLLCHSTVWNPPPSCRDYRVGPAGDSWSRLATLVNLLEKFSSSSDKNIILSEDETPDSELVRLPEDIILSGFTPLMSNIQAPTYTNKDGDMDAAQLCLRIKKIVFFGSMFLCGVDPPVLKLHKYETGHSEYVSVVEIPSPPEQSDSEVYIDSDSSDNESDDSGHQTSTVLDEEVDSNIETTADVADIQSLLHRKEALERSHKKQEKRRQKVQAILRECECEVTVEMEVRPHYLVPDTNCFIDYLPHLVAITKATSSSGQEHLYTLLVPLVVLNELEGLSKGARGSVVVPSRTQHIALLAEAARSALAFLRSGSHPAIRCVTTRGNVLSSSTFTAEEDNNEDMKNDDRILASCLNFSRLSSRGCLDKCNNSKEGGENAGKMVGAANDNIRRVYSEVVLLTEDRNLKVKALARDMPVSDMLHFVKWAGLGRNIEFG